MIVENYFGQFNPEWWKTPHKQEATDRWCHEFRVRISQKSIPHQKAPLLSFIHQLNVKGLSFPMLLEVSHLHYICCDAGHPGVQQWGVGRRPDALRHSGGQSVEAGAGFWPVGPAGEGRGGHAAHSSLCESPSRIFLWPSDLSICSHADSSSLKRCSLSALTRGWRCPFPTRPPVSAGLAPAHCKVTCGHTGGLDWIVFSRLPWSSHCYCSLDTAWWLLRACLRRGCHCVFRRY